MIPIVGTRIAIDCPKSYLVFPLLAVIALCARYKGGEQNNEHICFHYLCHDSTMRNLVLDTHTSQV